MTRKLWFEIEICGQRQKVFLATPNDPYLEGDEGTTVGEQLMCLVSTNLAEDRQNDTAIHELLHAVFDLSGAQYTAHDGLGIAPQQWVKIEERIIRGITPALHSMLKQLGGKLPKKPREKTRTIPDFDIEIEMKKPRRVTKPSRKLSK